MTTLTRYDWNAHDKMLIDAMKRRVELLKERDLLTQWSQTVLDNKWDLLPDADLAKAIDAASKLLGWSKAPAPIAQTDAAAELPTGGHRAPAPVNPELAEAREYLKAYTGTWQFMLTLQSELAQGQLRFTDRVIEVIMNNKRREAQWAAERSAKMVDALEPAATVEQLDEGRRWYAVDNDEGTLTFLRITRVPSGWTFVDQVIGGQPEAPRGRITPQGEYRGTFKALYEKVQQDPEAAMLRYGQEIGRCGHCGRHLTDEASRAAGIGPVCASKGGF